MRFFYSLLMYLLSPYLLLRLYIKGKTAPQYKDRVAERFSVDAVSSIDVDVWVHAVSLGEVIAAIPLIDALLMQKRMVLVTTMTPTGYGRVHSRFGNKVMHRYIPYDLPCAVSRFFYRVRPRVGIIMETELWPNLIFYAHKQHFPLFLVNARLSQRSFNGYKCLKWLVQPVLSDFTLIMAQAEEDARRFISLGAPVDKVQIMGNVKFDLQTDAIDYDKFNELKGRWGKSRPVFIAASTHDDEEVQILAHIKRLQDAIPDCVVLIAARHPERFKAVFQLAMEAGFNTGLRSKPETLSIENAVVVLDSLGELLGWFSVSDYAFMGGSLVPVGGHNVLEPIAVGVPVLSGRHVDNFKTIYQELGEVGGIFLVDDAEELIDKLIFLYKNQAEKEKMIENARSVLVRNKGALGRLLEVVDNVL